MKKKHPIISLRHFKKSDLNDMYEYCSDINIGPNAGWPPHKNREETQVVLNKFIKAVNLFAIVYRPTNKVIGSIGLHYDNRRSQVNAMMLGYVISSEYQNQGLMSLIAPQMLEYGFNKLNLDVISAYHYPTNYASKRVIEKTGFKFDGILRHSECLYDGTITDLYCYSYLKTEYNK